MNSADWSVLRWRLRRKWTSALAEWSYVSPRSRAEGGGVAARARVTGVTLRGAAEAAPRALSVARAAGACACTCALHAARDELRWLLFAFGIETLDAQPTDMSRAQFGYVASLLFARCCGASFGQLFGHSWTFIHAAPFTSPVI